ARNHGALRDAVVVFRARRCAAQTVREHLEAGAQEPIADGLHRRRIAQRRDAEGNPQGHAARPDAGGGRAVRPPRRDSRVLLHAGAAGGYRTGNRAGVRVHPRTEAHQSGVGNHHVHLYPAAGKRQTREGSRQAQIDAPARRAWRAGGVPHDAGRMDRASLGRLCLPCRCALAHRQIAPAHLRFRHRAALPVPYRAGSACSALGQARGECDGIVALSASTLQPSVGAQYRQPFRAATQAADHGRVAMAALHVAQLNFPPAPVGLGSEALLEQWPTLADIAESVAGAGIRVSVLQAASHSERLTRNRVDYCFVDVAEARSTEAKGRRFTSVLADMDVGLLHAHGLGFVEEAYAIAGRLSPAAPIVFQDHADRPPRWWRRARHRRRFALASGVAFTSLDQAKPFAAASMFGPSTRLLRSLNPAAGSRPEIARARAR